MGLKECRNDANAQEDCVAIRQLWGIRVTCVAPRRRDRALSLTGGPQAGAHGHARRSGRTGQRVLPLTLLLSSIARVNLGEMTRAAPVATVGVAACRDRPVTGMGGSIRHTSHKARQAFTDEVAVHFMARFVARNNVNSCAVARRSWPFRVGRRGRPTPRHGLRPPCEGLSPAAVRRSAAARPRSSD